MTPAATTFTRRTRPALRARRSVTLADPLAAQPDYDALAHELELELLRFTAQRQAITREERPRRVGWSPAIVRAFERILALAKRGLGAPPGALPRRVLLQTRVTLEAEVELARRAYGPTPETIRTQVRSAFVQVALHLRAQPKTERAARRARNVGLSWPLAPLIVTSPFGYRRDPILGSTEVRFHSGVDLGGGSGDVVSAAGPGRVTSAGWSGGHGRTVTVQHAGGLVTMYAHLRRILVKPGAEVHRGTPVGLVGSTGRATGPHLHFEVRRGNVPLDPVSAIGPGAAGLAQSGAR